MITATIGTILMVAVVATSIVIVRRRLRYETWYAVHLLAYAGIALAWLDQILTGNELVARVVVPLVRAMPARGGTKIISKHQKIANVSVPTYPDHTGRSLYINQTALPYLVQEALQAQSANVQMISGATYSIEAFASSLQGALAQAAFKA
jgi:hypothetical protein